MTFLNASLLIGLLAIAIPVVLHLTGRRDPKRVVFGSLFLLTRRFETNRTRLRVKKYWLLATRIAALAAVAMTLAAPLIAPTVGAAWIGWAIAALVAIGLIITASLVWANNRNVRIAGALAVLGLLAVLAVLGWGGYLIAAGPSVTIGDGGPVAVAVIVDNGPTSAQLSGDAAVLLELKTQAETLIRRLPADSRVAVLDRSSVPPSFAPTAAAAVTRVQTFVSRDAAVPINARIDSAKQLLRRSELTSKHVVILSGGTESVWAGFGAADDLGFGSGDQFAAATAGRRGDDADSAVAPILDAAALHIVVPEIEIQSNRSVAIPRFTTDSPKPGVPIGVSVELSMSGGTAPIEATLQLERYETDPALPVFRNDELVLPKLIEIDRKAITIPVSGSIETVLTLPPLPAGFQHGQIRLLGRDSLITDDARYWSLQIRQPADVLLVAANDQEAFVIEQTMADYKVQTIQPRDLALVQLRDFAAIVLLDPSVATLKSESLANAIEAGSRVLIALGPGLQMDPDAGSGASDGLPVWMPRLVRRWRSPPPGKFWVASDSSHPLLESLPSPMPWRDYPIFQHWQILPRQGGSALTTLFETAGTATGTDGSSSIIDGGSGAHPGLVELIPAKRGSVLIVTTPLPALIPPAADWNELFGGDPWPIWLTIRKSMDYLANGNEPRLMLPVNSAFVLDQSLLTGSSSRNSPTDSAGDTFDDSAVARVQLIAPESSAAVPIELPGDGQTSGYDAGANSIAATVLVRGTDRRGVYWLRGSRSQTGGTPGFSVNVPPEQLRLERFDFGTLNHSPATAIIEVVRSVSELNLSSNEGRRPQPIRSPILLFALIAFLAEQVLSNRFYGIRPGAGKQAAG